MVALFAAVNQKALCFALTNQNSVTWFLCSHMKQHLKVFSVMMSPMSAMLKAIKILKVFENRQKFDLPQQKTQLSAVICILDAA